LNNDGNTDIAVTNLNSGDVSAVLGDGQGRFSFAADSPFHIGTRPAAVAVGDSDGDGKPDLAIANADDNQVSILLGYGDGTSNAAAKSPITAGLRPDSIAVADFNSRRKA
jgi:Tol biopolymer transport system component